MEQRYRQDTLILETTFTTASGVVRLTDCMPPDDLAHDVVRVVEGVSGEVALKMILAIRFDYGTTIPWVRHENGGVSAIAGPNALILHSDVETRGEGLTTVAEFTLRAGERLEFALAWHQSHEPPPVKIEVQAAIAETEKYWREWSAHCSYKGRWREAVVRSLITLKALTYLPTGGIVAAPTTSLPEFIGGVRNWDYRYCWLRDATFTLLAFMHSGFTEEARAWGDWLLRAVAGTPSQLQIMYGVAGERRLREFELEHLAGYEGSRPVRVGNAAAEQFQLDVYGEIADAMHVKRHVGLKSTDDGWSVQRHMVEFVIQNWRKPDEGIWEIRGPRRHFTHSKVMAWVTLDRSVKAVEHFGLKGDVERWRAVRQEIFDDVCSRGYHATRECFVQYYGGERLDASLLMLPLVGFLPADDPRMRRTIFAIRDELTVDGLVNRYNPGASTDVDGLPPGEGTFLPCSFWMVDCLLLLGHSEEAHAMFERLLALRTPLGLLAEEYDGHARRLLGNFPQAFSHVALVNSALSLAAPQQAGDRRSGH